MFLRVLPLLFALSISTAALAKLPLVHKHTMQIPDASQEFINNCLNDLACELSLFQEISKLLRPSREETPVLDYILKLKSTAEKSVWKQSLISKQDKLGNLIIYLPATGKFVRQTAPSIALQAHTDMVLAHKLATPGEDLRPYFKNGVDLKITGDLLHSKDRLSTIGADNGAGVAILLRYLIDATLTHPPLELIFTVREEVGLAGALGITIPVDSSRMINLDGMATEPGVILVASQGAARSLASGELPTEKQGPDATRIRVSLGNLAGGHSGADIHLNRLNSVQGFAHMLNHLYQRVPQLRIVSVIAGEGSALNKIPNSFVAELAVPTADVNADLLKYLETGIQDLIAQHSQDNLSSYTLKIEPLSSPADSLTLTTSSSRSLADSILKTLNGVLEKDKTYPNEVATSSNLGALKISASGLNKMDLLIGTMSRSFFSASLAKVVNEIQDTLKIPFAKSGSVTFSDGGSYPAWQSLPKSDLLSRALSLKNYFYKTSPTAVGIEPSVFAQKYPQMDIISFSPLIRNAHTINEEISLSSWKQTIEGLQALLALD